MLDAVLVHPIGSNWLPNLERSVNSVNRMAPIGLMSISSYLKRQGFSVKILDYCAFPKKKTDIVTEIISYKPRFVGISCTTSSFTDGYSLAKAIKKQLLDIKVVFGGVHVSSQREKILDAYPEIDYVIVGEGEEALSKLIGGEKLQSIKGLIYRSNGKTKFNGYQRDLLYLDTLPFPDYAGLKGFPESYNLPLFNYPTAPNATLITSRGCPFQCSFCDRSVFKKGYRYNSARYIYEHINYLKRKYGIRHVNIYDDLFTYDRKRILTLSEMLIKKPLHVTYNCAVRFDTLDDELLDALKKSGCWMISIGIESGDQEVLQRNKANYNLQEIVDSVKIIKKHGIRVKGLFIMGMPGESEKSIKRTQKFIFSMPLDDINVSKFAPFPGAPVYFKLKKAGNIMDDWEKMNCMTFIYKPDAIESLERLEQLYNSFIADYYERPTILFKYFKMLWKSPHSWYSLLRRLPDFIAARKYFKSTEKIELKTN